MDVRALGVSVDLGSLPVILQRIENDISVLNSRSVGAEGVVGMYPAS